MEESAAGRNDILFGAFILKLAATQLLDDWQRTIVKDGNARIIASARYFFRKKKDLSKKFGEAAAQMSIAFAEKTETVSEVDNPNDYESLLGISGIDPGEAILFSAAIGLPDYLIVAGDKVALKALQAETKRGPFRKKLKGRIIAFEQVILALIKAGDFATIRERIAAAEKSDTVMKVAFGLGLETTEAKAIEALEHYIANLRKATGGLLISEQDLKRLIS